MYVRLRHLALLSSLLVGVLQGPWWIPPTIFDFPQDERRRPEVSQPIAQVRVQSIGGNWTHDPEVSWYGPGFYGRRTACGKALTKDLQGVAHRSLPCGTLVQFRWKGRVATVPVVDRGPYVAGRIWDLTGGTCVYLDHCFTGPIEYRILGE